MSLHAIEKGAEPESAPRKLEQRQFGSIRVSPKLTSKISISSKIYSKINFEAAKNHAAFESFFTLRRLLPRLILKNVVGAHRGPNLDDKSIYFRIFVNKITSNRAMSDKPRLIRRREELSLRRSKIGF